MTVEDKILNIKIEYKKFDKQSDYEEDQYINYEKFQMDRNSEKINIEKITGNNVRLKEEIYFKEAIEDFFDMLDHENLFTGIKEVESKNDNPIGTLKYKITVQYDFMERTIEGDFDKEGLPQSYKNFVEAYLSLVGQNNYYEILNP